MERLIEKDQDLEWVKGHLSYSCTEKCEEVNGECWRCDILYCMEVLADYEHAKEKGRLVYLPVKVGDYAYIPMGGKIYHNKVLSYFISDDSFLVCVEYYPNEASSAGQWLKASNVFANQEEAEAKLKEMEADNE